MQSAVKPDEGTRRWTGGQQAAGTPSPASAASSAATATSRPTAQQRERAERNRLEALRRQAASRQAASRQAASRQAAPTSSSAQAGGVWSRPTSAASTPMPAQSLRTVFQQPASVAHTGQLPSLPPQPPLSRGPIQQQHPPVLPSLASDWPRLAPSPGSAFAGVSALSLAETSSNAHISGRPVLQHAAAASPSPSTPSHQHRGFPFQPPQGLVVASSIDSEPSDAVSPQPEGQNPTARPGWSASRAAPQAAPRAAVQPAGRRSRGGKAFGSGGKVSANVTYSFDPTPRPAKPMTQSTLHQSLRRHTKAKAERQQLDSQGLRQASGPLAVERAAAASRNADAPAFAPQPCQLPAPQQPSWPTPVPSIRPAPAAMSAGRPPLAPRPAYAAAAHTIASAWAPPQLGARAPSLLHQGNPADAQARRAKLRRLLAADADPFAAGTANGRRWAWLAEPHDAQRRPPAHPNHDPTTLFIPDTAWGTELRGADSQYWAIKSKGCAHMVLFFQEGNFMHLKDRDADIGMRAGLRQMGGARGSAANMWTVGCNISAFNECAAKVLALGYVVGRVDEDRRGQREPGTALVRRCLTRVYTPGTLLDPSMLDASGASQPLVTLFEGASLRFGACVVDVHAATISFASWQEADTERSMLRSLLLTVDPAEVGFAGGQLAPATCKLLRGLGPVTCGGRPAVLTPIRHLLPCDPDAEGAAEVMLEYTADMFAAQGGKPATFRAAAGMLTPHSMAAVQLAVQHLRAAQAARQVLPHCSLASLDGRTGAHASGFMLLDACATQSLELLASSDGRPPGSLLHLLDRTATAAGSRRVRQFVTSPLFRPGDIEERLATVERFMSRPGVALEFQAAIHRAPDCERLLTRAASALATVVERVAGAEEADEAMAFLTHEGPWQPPRQDAAAASSHWASPSPCAPAASQQSEASGRMAQLTAVMDLSQATFLPVMQLLQGAQQLQEAVQQLCQRLQATVGAAAPLPPPLQRAALRGEAVADTLQLMCQAFCPERFNDAAADMQLEPGLSAEYDEALQRVGQLQAQAGATLQEVRSALAARGHGEAALRRVKLADYRGEQLLEVPTALRRDMEAAVACIVVKEAQTLARYRVLALADTLRALEDARDAARLWVLQYLAESAQLFLDSCDAFRDFLSAVATLDALAGFAAATHPLVAPPGCTYCRPRFAASAPAAAGVGGAAPPLRLLGVWNPALQASGVEAIHANDLSLGCGGQPGLLLLTGANTAGKSTLLRASCLAVIMAQIGCYVPAAAAELAPVDRVFTRIGAQDRIASGESTFAVEMLETAALLRHSTPASLLAPHRAARRRACAPPRRHLLALPRRHTVPALVVCRRRCWMSWGGAPPPMTGTPSRLAWRCGSPASGAAGACLPPTTTACATNRALRRWCSWRTWRRRQTLGAGCSRRTA